jgi:hypothetical protein
MVALAGSNPPAQQAYIICGSIHPHIYVYMKNWWTLAGSNPPAQQAYIICGSIHPHIYTYMKN